MANLSTNAAINQIAQLLGAAEESSTNGALNLILTAIEEAEGGGGAGYLVYSALLTQTGTSAPVATVLENTINPDLAWFYIGPGRYGLYYPGLVFPPVEPFTVNKTTVTLTLGVNNNPIYSLVRISDGVYSEPTVVQIGVKNNNTDTNVNGVLVKAFIEIRVYP